MKGFMKYAALGLLGLTLLGCGKDHKELVLEKPILEKQIYYDHPVDTGTKAQLQMYVYDKSDYLPPQVGPDIVELRVKFVSSYSGSEDTFTEYVFRDGKNDALDRIPDEMEENTHKAPNNDNTAYWTGPPFPEGKKTKSERVAFQPSLDGWQGVTEKGFFATNWMPMYDVEKRLNEWVGIYDRLYKHVPQIDSVYSSLGVK